MEALNLLLSWVILIMHKLCIYYCYKNDLKVRKHTFELDWNPMFSVRSSEVSTNGSAKSLNDLVEVTTIIAIIKFTKLIKISLSE